MRNPVPISAGWALWGKRPGTNDDYSVLSCSTGPFSRAEFAAIMPRYAPGTPSVRRRGAGELPWVTFSWVGAEERLHLGIAVQDGTEQLDGAGRPITETRYFCVPYAALATSPVSYTSLFEAVAGLRLLPDGGGPIELALPALDPEELALSITEFGEEVVSRTASLLLEGRVSIVQADASKLEDRVRFLDAVAALLPYGYRAKYTAATWSDSGARHRIRLAFADRPHSDAAPVVWHRPTEIQAGGTAARAYLAQLDRVRGRSADSGTPVDLAIVIARLSREVTPRKFDDAQPAIASIRRIDLPLAVLSDVRGGAADPAEVRQLFQASQVTVLPGDGQLALLAELISYGAPSDWSLVARWWDTIVAGQPQVMLPALAAYSRRMLWAATPSPAIREHLVLVGRYGLADDLLAELVIPAPGEATPGALAGAAQLVREFAVGPDLAGFPRTRDALTSSPAVVAEVLAQLAAAQTDTKLVPPWLKPAIPGALTPILSVLAKSPRETSAAAVAQLANVDVECVRALLYAAAHATRLDWVLPGFAGWLMGRSEVGSRQQDYWRGHLLALGPLLPGRGRACVDLALLATGSQPRWLLATTDDPAWPSYRDCFADEWWKLGLRQGTPDGDRLFTVLSHYLDEQPWPATPEQANGVADLTERLTSGEPFLVLRGIVASVLVRVPGEWSRIRALDWLDRVNRITPSLVRKAVEYSLLRLPPDAPASRIAVLCERAFLGRLPADDAGRAAARSGALGSRATGIDILEELSAHFGVAVAPEASGGSLLRRLTVLAGPFGDSAPRDGPQQEFADWLGEFVRSAKKAQSRRRGHGPGQQNGPAREARG
jgi:hypothetical protein